MQEPHWTNAGLRLNELVDALVVMDPDAEVRLSHNTRLTVGGLSSYRGFYENLALEPMAVKMEGEAFGYPVTVRSLVVKLRDAVGKEFSGYKGGEFKMGPRETIWVSSWGHCDQRYITGVKPKTLGDGKKVVVLVTRKEED
jgi:hypothetical protein